MVPAADTRQSANPLQPFLSHLVNLLSSYEHGPLPTSVSRYDGPSDGQTEDILRSIDAIGRRMHTAEAELASIKDSEMSIPESKKRRRGGSSSPSDANGQGITSRDVEMKDTEAIDIGEVSRL